MAEVFGRSEALELGKEEVLKSALAVETSVLVLGPMDVDWSNWNRP